MLIVLYTKVDAQCDKLETVTILQHLQWLTNHGSIFLSPGFGTKFQRKLPLF